MQTHYAIQAISPPETGETTATMPSSPEGCIQVIDENGIFCDDLQDQIDGLGLQAGYHIVSVFGSQSSGKSTMLNHTFGTHFGVMDVNERQKTTRGILMSRARDLNLIVMDVEGTDGAQQRDNKKFERASALFSLASSQVLIINMWENQVGLREGANIALLESILEANLTLFGTEDPSRRPPRTMLLFVIRDHIGHTPLASLQETISQTMKRSWDHLRKPEALRRRQLDDYFDVRVTSLPHKIYKEMEFEQEVARLRSQFADRSLNDFVFKPEFDRPIPTSGIAWFMRDIWQRVGTSDSVNLPETKKLLAQYFCDKFSGEAIENLQEQVRESIEVDSVVVGLGQMMRTRYNEALGRFDASALGYDEEVYEEKRKDLIVKLKAELSPLFYEQLKRLRLRSLARFKNSLVFTLFSPRQLLANVQAERYRAKQNFQDVAKEALGQQKSADGPTESLDSTWAYRGEFTKLENELNWILGKYCAQMASLNAGGVLLLVTAFALPPPPLLRVALGFFH